MSAAVDATTALLARVDPPPPVGAWRVGVKDAYRARGLPTTFGTRAQAVVVSGGRSGEASAVTALRAAGATIAAKTNCTEICIGDYVLAGTPPNPRAPGRGVGGSSGGCASAVAGGILDASLGTDTGGSVRIPAAYCGVLAFKPTTGLVALDGAVALAPTLDCAGVIAATPADLLRAAAALAPGLAVDACAPNALVVDPSIAVDRTVAAGLERVARLLGARLVRPRWDDYRQPHEVLVAAEAARAHPALLDDPALGARARGVLEDGAGVSAARLAAARAQSAAVGAAIVASLPGSGVLVTPAVDGPAPEGTNATRSAAWWAEMDWVAPLNHARAPAAVTPLRGARPPVALQVTARPGHDRAVLAAAAWLATAV